ncbi:RNA polymerase sigma factor [Parapedobacter sp. DT-150]|uniref:RNA polymerase sigma factor n=1 Tax=Parapedobacter sp. DT-150 TaxID=3396162 RepID=UPI003F1E1806
MEKDKPEDRMLWHQIQNGSVAAFTQLVNRYSNPLYGYGMRFSPDEELVRDCIQDVFLTLWNRKEHLSEVSNAKFYLMKALRQKIIRELPKWQRTASLNNIPIEELSFAVDFEEEATLPGAIRDKVKSYLDQLSPRQKELLYLRFYENLKQDKIAELMGISRQSSYNLQHNALLALRKLIDYDSIVALISLSCFFLVAFFI